MNSTRFHLTLQYTIAIEMVGCYLSIFHIFIAEDRLSFEGSEIFIDLKLLIAFSGSCTSNVVEIKRSHSLISKLFQMTF